MKIESLKLESFSQSPAQGAIEEAFKKASGGRFYKITRHYVVQEIVQGNTGQVYDVSLNIVERCMMALLKLFGKDYIASLTPFKGKEVKILSAATAGLVVSPNQPSPKVESDDVIKRVICWKFTSATPSIHETKKTADELLKCIKEKNSQGTLSPNTGPGKVSVDLATMRRRHGFENLSEKELEIALNYLVVTRKIGHYAEDQDGTMVICIDPTSKVDPSWRDVRLHPSRGEAMTLQRLFEIDEYLHTQRSPIEDLKKSLAREGTVDSKLLELLSEIEGFHISDAIAPSNHEISTILPDKKQYLDLLIRKKIIFAWTVSSGKKTYVAIRDPAPTAPQEWVWRSMKDLQQEDEFNRANTITLATLPSDWPHQDLALLTQCVQKLNERGKPGKYEYTFDCFRDGFLIADYLKKENTIFDFHYDLSNPLRFSFYVKQEDAATLT